MLWLTFYQPAVAFNNDLYWDHIKEGFLESAEGVWPDSCIRLDGCCRLIEYVPCHAACNRRRHQNSYYPLEALPENITSVGLILSKRRNWTAPASTMRDNVMMVRRLGPYMPLKERAYCERQLIKIYSIKYYCMVLYSKHLKPYETSVPSGIQKGHLSHLSLGAHVMPAGYLLRHFQYPPQVKIIITT